MPTLTEAASLIAHRIACPEAGYPYSEAAYADVADYEQQTGLKYTPIQPFAELVLELISLFETKEESDSGREFYPTTITSCRTAHLERLRVLMPEIKRLAQEAMQ